MKTKILYVLVSSEADVYLEQALVSAYSARRHNPDAVLTLLSVSRKKFPWISGPTSLR